MKKARARYICLDEVGNSREKIGFFEVLLRWTDCFWHFSLYVHKFWGPWGGFCSEYCLVIRVCGRLSGRRNSDGPRRGKVGLVCRVVSLIPTVK